MKSFFKGLYTEAIVVATCLTLALLLVCWVITALANSLTAALVVAVCFWRIVFLWVMDT